MIWPAGAATRSQTGLTWVRWITAVVTLLSCLCKAAAADQWLAPSVIVGRNELQIARFEDARAPNAVMAEQLKKWGRRRAPIQRSSDGPWQVAVQAAGQWVETVRVRAQPAGSEGLRIRQRLAPAGAADAGAGRASGERGPLADLLPQASVLTRSDQQGDGGRTISTWVLSSALNLVALERQLLERARGAGYTDALLTTGGSGAAESALSQSKPLWFKRGRDEVVVAATASDRGALVVVHWSRPR